MSSEADRAAADAWKYHRSGDHDMAIMRFNEVVQQYPQDIDVLYGLAQAQHAAGDYLGAKATFMKLQTILQGKLSTSDEDDVRVRMVYRMVKQQLERLG